MKRKLNWLPILFIMIIFTSCKNNEKPIEKTINTTQVVKEREEKIEVDSEIKTTTPKEIINKFLALPQVKNASVGIKVKNLDKNKVLYEKNPEISLVPASNLKLLTTGIAIDTLGKDYRFKTKITYDGVIDKNGTLRGNIYIIGGGDPTLGSKYLVAKNPSRMTGIERKEQLKFLDTWIDEIKALGIKKIDGKVIADPSYLPQTTLSPTWEWGDLRYSFASHPSGLTFMDNTIRLTLRKYKNEIKPEVSPMYSNTKVINKVVVDSKKSTKITVVVVPYSNEIIVLGVLNNSIASYTTVMQDPATTLATVFSKELNFRGISNNGSKLRDTKSGIERYEENQNMKEIYINYSPKLEEILKYTNKYSVNLFAEHLKLEVERKSGKSLKKLLAEKIGVEGLYMYDGSGLSRYDGVTPDIMVDMLEYMKKSEEFDEYYNSLAKPNENGTFKNFKKGTILVENLHGKSGTLTGVKSYSGYMYNKKGDLLAFSILVNHHGMSGTTIGKELEKVMESFYYLK